MGSSTVSDATRTRLTESRNGQSKYCFFVSGWCNQVILASAPLIYKPQSKENVICQNNWGDFGSRRLTVVVRYFPSFHSW